MRGGELCLLVSIQNWNLERDQFASADSPVSALPLTAASGIPSAQVP